MKTILMVCCLGLMCLLFSSVVVAQTTSNIQGTVKDAKGAVVAGAEVKATSAALSVERTATSDGDGFYRLAGAAGGNLSRSPYRPGTLQVARWTMSSLP